MPDKKVLFITYDLPPQGGVNVLRPLKFLKYLSNFGWQPVVITAQCHSSLVDKSLLGDMPSQISINRVISLAPSDLSGRFEKKIASRKIGKFIHSFCKFALKVYSIFYYRLAFIDWEIGWVPFAIKEAKKIIKKNQIDLIYVRGEPFSTFLIGYRLKRIFSIPLVIDYDDPWTTSVYAQRSCLITRKILNSLEKRIVSFSDRVVCCSRTLKEDLLKKYPEIDSQKIVVIYNGYDKDDFKMPEAEKKDDSRMFFTYTGRIGRKFYYSPESFFYALRQLVDEGKIRKSEILIRLIGSMDNFYSDLIKKLQLEDVVVSHGYVDHKKSVGYLMSSDILLYILEASGGKEISYKFSYVVSAKLFEYFYSGQPILAIVPLGAEVRSLLNYADAFIAECNNIESVKNLLYEVFLKYKNGVLKIKPDLGAIEKFDRRNLTGELVRVFDKVLAGVD